MKEILKVSDLFSSYNKTTILKNISFSVYENDFLGIIGPNASGKTTLFRVITKILTPDSGETLLFEKNINKYTYKELARLIAVIPQVLEIFFPFNVYEFVSMGRYAHNEKNLGLIDKVVDRVLKETDIQDLKERSMKKLSGGERQRAIIAQALAQEPKLILLDEPVTHLDIKYQFEILNLLKKQNEKGMTVVVILHDLNLASEYCNRLILLSSGEKVADDIPEKVLREDIIKSVYKTEVAVQINPVSRKPFIIAINKR